MPERARVRWSQLKVGVIALAAFIILFVLVFLLTSARGIFKRNVLLLTYMDDAGGIQKGAPVRLNGYTIGYLDDVKLTSSREPRRTVRFEMMIPEEFLKDIPVDSVAQITAASLLGDKFIDITKGPSQQHVKEGDEIPSLQSQDIPELMGQMANVLKTFQNISGRVDSLLAGVDAGKGNLGLFLKDEELYRRLNSIASEGQQLLSDVRNGKGTLSMLLYDQGLYNDLRAPLKRIDAILADLEAGQGSAGKLLKDPTLYNEFDNTLKQIRDLVAGLNAGQGTAGKFLKSDELHQKLSDLVSKLNQTMDRIEAGQGSIGQFVVNPQLYEALAGATREFQSLAKDMHANPKKFLTIQLKIF